MIQTPFNFQALLISLLLFTGNASDSDDSSEDDETHTSESKHLALVEYDKFGNSYLHVDVRLNQTENVIADLDYDFIVMNVTNKSYKKANRVVLGILTETLEIEKDQLVLISGKKEAWKKIMLLNYKGTDQEVAQMLYKACKGTAHKERFQEFLRVEKRKQLLNEDEEAFKDYQNS